MDKKIALALTFETAPAKVKTAAKAHWESHLRLQRADNQTAKWRAEWKNANDVYQKSLQDLESELEKWDPSKKNGPVEEIPDEPVV